jgi:hypothetical protein
MVRVVMALQLCLRADNSSTEGNRQSQQTIRRLFNLRFNFVAGISASDVNFGLHRDVLCAEAIAPSRAVPSAHKRCAGAQYESHSTGPRPEHRLIIAASHSLLDCRGCATGFTTGLDQPPGSAMSALPSWGDDGTRTSNRSASGDIPMQVWEFQP